MGSGLKRVFITPLDTVDDSDKEGVGTRRIEGDDEYLYLQGVASVAAGTMVTVARDYTTAVLTTALGATPKRLAVAKAAVVANKFGWFQIRGQGNVLGVANCATGVALYTDTSNAGHVDDTAASEHAISGCVLAETVGGSNALATCILDNPWTAPNLD